MKQRKGEEEGTFSSRRGRGIGNVAGWLVARPLRYQLSAQQIVQPGIVLVRRGKSRFQTRVLLQWMAVLLTCFFCKVKCYVSSLKHMFSMTKDFYWDYKDSCKNKWRTRITQTLDTYAIKFHKLLILLLTQTIYRTLLKISNYVDCDLHWKILKRWVEDILGLYLLQHELYKLNQNSINLSVQKFPTF